MEENLQDGRLCKEEYTVNMFVLRSSALREGAEGGGWLSWAMTFHPLTDLFPLPHKMKKEMEAGM